MPQLEDHAELIFRKCFLHLGRDQHFANGGENEPTGMKSSSVYRVRRRDIPSHRTRNKLAESSLPGEDLAHLLQTLATKSFGPFGWTFRRRIDSELCGKEDQLKIGYNLQTGPR